MTLWLPVALLSFQAASLRPAALHPRVCMSEASKEESTLEEPEAAPESPAPTTPKRMDLKAKTAEQRKEGVGFNQFDPVLSLTGFISRRFGLVGGLGIVALLAATEGNEILKSILDTGPQPGSGETITTASGLQYVDLLISSSGDTPLPGAVIGFNAKVSIGDVTLFDSTAGKNAKPIAFKYGQRPFQNVVCEGVEEGIRGMRAGSKRTLLVPKALAPKGVDVPDGVPLTYEIELLEVLPGYF